MKLFEVPMRAMSLVGLCFLAGFGPPVAHADFTFGQPTNLGSTINSSALDACPCLSPDGLELYLYRGGAILVSRRATVDSEWGPPDGLGPTINGPGTHEACSISADGLSLYLDSDRPGGQGGVDLWVTTRATVHDDWGAPTSLGPVINTAYDDYGPTISPDGLELYFTSNRPGGLGSLDVWVTTRATVHDNWGAPTNLGATVNSPADENYTALSPDGLVLIVGSNRPGGTGIGLSLYDLYMTSRATRGDSWGVPESLGPIVNSPYVDGCPYISADGSTLYFTRFNDPRGYGAVDIWQASILPSADFNGDAKVDAADLAALEANWGRSEPVCDIGPFPWGDGVVDEKDLKVLMELLMTPGKRASDIPCNVVLSWIGPSLAESYDVYFGTSRDDVSNATRNDPCGVLVSEGQTETTCNPEGLLEFSKTYYWRVDLIDVPAGSAEPVVYKGSVLSFTTEPFARPIENIIATSSSSQAGTSPQKTVDGSGLDENDGHSTEMKYMWQSAAAPGPHWIQYEFDKICTLHELWVWNSNQVIEPRIGFGARTVKIEYSPDGKAWKALEGVPEFAQAPGQASYLHNTVVSFGGVQAKYVKLTIESNWGGVSPSTGLSEVRFFYIPDRSAYNP